MFPNGASDLNRNHHIPVPGRIQFYRAEQLPFLPDDAKTQIRFPKAVAQSEENLRYLEKVRDETTKFMTQEIKENYLTGDSSVGLSATLQEAEVLFGAGDNIRALSDSGELQKLHERFNSLSKQAQQEYRSIKERLFSVIASCEE